MKKIALYIGIITLAIIVVIALIVQFFSQPEQKAQAVSFTLAQSHVNVSIRQDTSEAREVALLTESKALTLPSGKYYYVVTGERIAPSTVKFTVPNDTQFTIDPDYSSSYLASLLESEVPAIDQLLETRYAKIANGYVIHPGKFYRQGQWYATIISDRRSTNEDPYDEYRIVLNKQNGNWVAVTTPEISLSAVTFPGVPHEILSDINKATIESLADWGNQDSLR